MTSRVMYGDRGHQDAGGPRTHSSFKRDTYDDRRRVIERGAVAAYAVRPALPTGPRAREMTSEGEPRPF